MADGTRGGGVRAINRTRLLVVGAVLGLAALTSACGASSADIVDDNPVTDGVCTPGYDPCIPPGSDVDCRNGDGDGPRFVDGPVTVAGEDPYQLDRDGNGRGCETP